MDQQGSRYVPFEFRDQLLWKHLGIDLYSPSAALSQIVANSLDAGCSRVDITIQYADPEMGGPELVAISDDGAGMSPEAINQAFRVVGEHMWQGSLGRDTIGSKGIGRFAIFALSSQSDWITVADIDGSRLRQSWRMTRALGINVDYAPAPGVPTGTTITFVPEPKDEVIKLFSTPHNVKWNLFNDFASYLLRYGDAIQIWVNGERVDPDEFVECSEEEDIGGTDGVPPAQLRHLLMGYHVVQPHTCMLQFASHGAAIKSQPLDGESVGKRKYLGLVDSPYLAELTNTGKSELASMDSTFRALECEATSRAKVFIGRMRDDRSRSFIDRLRAEPYYPYRHTKTVLDTVSRDALETVLIAIDEEVGISSQSSKLLRIVTLLTNQLLHSEDLATILTGVLDLKGDHVTRFAELLKSTTLNSVIAAAELVVNRIRFLEELKELTYGDLAPRVLERKQLHKIVQRETWLFGEEFNLMSSDTSINNLLPIIDKAVRGTSDPDAEIEEAKKYRDIPDLYFMSTKWNEGGRYHQHLIVELKRPSERIVPDHIEQLERYAEQIVNHPMFGQRPDSHKFRFVALSSQVSRRVKVNRYVRGKEPGFINAPDGYPHYTELWALQWSDYIEQRQEELKFLREKIEITADPQALGLLRRTAGGYLPTDLSLPQPNGHDGSVPPAA